MQKEEYIDDKLAFDIRCALAKEHIETDADKAFERMKASHDADTDDNTPEQRTQRRSFILPVLSLAAACAAILFCLIYINKVDGKSDTLGQSIYLAQDNDAQHIQITIDGKEIELGEKEAEENNIRLLNDDVIDFSASNILEGAEITQSTTISVPHGKVATLLLPDGTKAWLSPGSRIVFPLAFPSNAPREVRLTGEAYFSVTHDEAHPFIVNCEKFTTRVLGTEFNVRNYSGETPVVTLVEGSVNVSNGSKNITLKPEQCVETEGNESFKAKNTDIDVMTSWKNGEFYFDGQTLRQIALEIGRWYNLDVVVISDLHVNDSMHFNGERAWSVYETIKHLQEISKAQLEIHDNKILLK